MRRRQFLKMISSLVLGASLGSCSSFQPEPFSTGAVTTPPLGCVQLRAQQQDGDC